MESSREQSPDRRRDPNALMSVAAILDWAGAAQDAKLPRPRDAGRRGTAQRLMSPVGHSRRTNGPCWTNDRLAEDEGVSPLTQQADSRDPDRLPDSTDPSGPCPRCGRPSNFSSIGNGPITYGSNYMQDGTGYHRMAVERISILQCAYCQQNILVVEEELIGGVRNGRGGDVTWRGIHWWPSPGAGSLGADVSTDVARAYDEGVRALHANAPNAAAAMFRTALSYMVQEHGSDAARQKGDLKEKIKQMSRDGGPLASLSDWSDHVRLYGNAGAHPDLFGGVTLPEAQELSRLVHTMIELLYILPANIARRQSERRRTQG